MAGSIVSIIVSFLLMGGAASAAGLDTTGLVPVGLLPQPWKVHCETTLNPSQPNLDNTCGFNVQILGDLSEAQVALFQKTLAQKHAIEGALKFKTQLRVAIDSAGGSVRSALSLGRLIRKESGTAAVEDNDRCYSACIFVFMGGIDRWVGSTAKIAIHRPFFETDSNAPSPSGGDVKMAFSKLLQDIHSYADEMNVPRRIVDDMILIPSDSARHLDIDGLFSYGILPVDPFEKEARDLAAAKRLGITSAEYLARLNRIRGTCYPDRSDNPYLWNFFDRYDACYRNIMNPSR